MNQEFKRTIIMDNGTAQCRVGTTEYDLPKFIFSTQVGKLENWHLRNNQRISIGEEKYMQSGMFKQKGPIENGIIINWDDMERIWHYTYYDLLKIFPQEHATLLTQAPMNSKFNQERMTQIMFETFNVPLFSVFYTSVLSLLSSGRTTGIVCQSGHEITNSIPIYEGYQMPQAISKTDLAGKMCTFYLKYLLNIDGSSKNYSSEMQIVKEIKEKLCYIALDPKAEEEIYKNGSIKDELYNLPDGTILVRDQRFRCPEILFSPENFNFYFVGIHRMTYNSIMKCDIDIKRVLFENIVLAGGSTLFPGLPQRLQNEIQTLAPKQIKTKVYSPPDRMLSSWKGGCIISSLSTFQTHWISSSEYDEIGPAVVHRKCF